MYKHVLFLDLETYSDQDINFGAYAYSDSTQFLILLIAYAFDNGPVRLVDLQKEAFPEEVLEALQDPAVLKVAHNANFERIALSRYLLKDEFFPSDDWLCTMSYASFCNIPSSLENAGQILSIPDQKMEEGLEAILFFCRPDQQKRHLPEEKPLLWKIFCQYCIRDVEAMREIYYRLQQIAPFSPVEQQLYHLDQRINDRGFQVNSQKAQELIRKEKEFEKDFYRLCLSIDPFLKSGSRRSLKTFLKYQHIRTGIISEKTIRDLLKKDLSKPVRTVLEGWLKLEHPSARKIHNVLRMSGRKDGKIHGAFRYYGKQDGNWSLKALSPHLLEGHVDPHPFGYRKILPEGEEWREYRIPALCQLITPTGNKSFLQIEMKNADELIRHWMEEEYLSKVSQSWLARSFHGLDRQEELWLFYQELVWKDLGEWLFYCIEQADLTGKKITFLGDIQVQVRIYDQRKVLLIHTGLKPWILFDVLLEDQSISYLARPRKKEGAFLYKTPDQFLWELIHVLSRDLFAGLLLSLDEQGFELCLIHHHEILVEALKNEETIRRLKTTLSTWSDSLFVHPDVEWKWTDYYEPSKDNAIEA